MQCASYDRRRDVMNSRAGGGVKRSSPGTIPQHLPSPACAQGIPGAGHEIAESPAGELHEEDYREKRGGGAGREFRVRAFRRADDGTGEEIILAAGAAGHASKRSSSARRPSFVVQQSKSSRRTGTAQAPRSESNPRKRAGVCHGRSLKSPRFTPPARRAIR